MSAKNTNTESDATETGGIQADVSAHADSVQSFAGYEPGIGADKNGGSLKWQGNLPYLVEPPIKK